MPTPQSAWVPEVEVRVKLVPLTDTEYDLTHWKKLTALQSADTVLLSKVMMASAVLYVVADGEDEDEDEDAEIYVAIVDPDMVAVGQLSG